MIRDRLKELRERASISMRDMAIEVGMKGSGYSHYELRFKGEHLPLAKAIKFADVLERHGVPREEVLALAGTPAATSGASTEAAPEEVAFLPVYDVAASACPGTYVEYEVVAERITFPRAYLRRITNSSPERLAIIAIRGDSMEPTLHHGDIVLVDTTKTDYSFDGLFVLEMDGTLHVKRLARSGTRGMVQVLSDNRLYPPVEYRANDIRIVGKVRWRGGAMG